jgi:hypothetical protein
VVFDLAAPEVQVLGIVPAGSSVLVELGRPGSVAARAGPEVEPAGLASAPANARDDTAAAPAGADAVPADGTQTEVADPPSPDRPDGDRLPPPEVPALTVTDVSLFDEEDGSTRVTVDADRPFPPYSVRELHLAGNPPRYVISILGQTADGLPEELSVAGATLRRIRILERDQQRPGEVHVVFELASVEARVTDVKRTGSQITIRLSTLGSQ